MAQSKLQYDLQHAFVLRFTSADDLQYYVHTDPQHKAFKEAVGPLLEKENIVVYDFAPGAFLSPNDASIAGL